MNSGNFHPQKFGTPPITGAPTASFPEVYATSQYYQMYSQPYYPQMYPQQLPEDFNPESFDNQKGKVPKVEKIDYRCLLVRGIKSITTEESIKEAIQIFAPVESVRVIRDKISGESRGFAFVDFFSVEDAKSVLVKTKGTATIDGSAVQLDFSKHSIRQPNQDPTQQDWICPMCQGNNFARRKVCYLCQAPKPDNPEVCVVTEKIESNVPCPVIVVRGLDPVTVEATLVNIYAKFGNLKEIRLIRERHSQISRGFCFVEYYDTEGAQNAMEHAAEIKIDGRYVRMAYTHRGNGAHTDAIEQAKWLSGTANSAPKINTTALAAINSGDTSQFVFNEQMGIYYNAKNGFYYDPTNNYYWDSLNGVYFYFDEQTGKYAPAEEKKETQFPSNIPFQDHVSSASSSTQPTEPEQKPKKKKEKVPTSTPSKKITKEIEKWSQVQKSETPKAPETSTESEHVVGNICLLCKRQFNSIETLRKHVEMSQLHKTNLELAQAKQEEKNKEKEKEAIERRNIKKRKLELSSSTTVSITESGTDLNEKNVGHQLLEKMGWKKGDTIGSSQATVTAPIQVSMIPERAGLGSFQLKNSSGDSFQENIRKRMRSLHEDE